FMDALRMTRRDDARLGPDVRRVIVKPFLPGDPSTPDGTARLRVVVERIMAMSEREVAATLGAALGDFGDRHRDIDGVLDRHFGIAAARIDGDATMSELALDRRRLIGAYFTHEYSIEAAALGNPSIVAAPDQQG